jgi:hypothetical protein
VRKPDRLQLVLSSQHLNEVFDHDIGNATVRQARASRCARWTKL